MEVRSTFSAACFMSVTPTGVEPVNDTLRRRGSAMMGVESADEVLVVKTLTTPLGTPTSSRILTK